MADSSTTPPVSPASRGGSPASELENFFTEQVPALIAGPSSWRLLCLISTFFQYWDDAAPNRASAVFQLSQFRKDFWELQQGVHAYLDAHDPKAIDFNSEPYRWIRMPCKVDQGSDSSAQDNQGLDIVDILQACPCSSDEEAKKLKQLIVAGLKKGYAVAEVVPKAAGCAVDYYPLARYKLDTVFAELDDIAESEPLQCLVTAFAALGFQASRVNPVRWIEPKLHQGFKDQVEQFAAERPDDMMSEEDAALLFPALQITLEKFRDAGCDETPASTKVHDVSMDVTPVRRMRTPARDSVVHQAQTYRAQMLEVIMRHRRIDLLCAFEAKKMELKAFVREELQVEIEDDVFGSPTPFTPATRAGSEQRLQPPVTPVPFPGDLAVHAAPTPSPPSLMPSPAMPVLTATSVFTPPPMRLNTTHDLSGDYSRVSDERNTTLWQRVLAYEYWLHAEINLLKQHDVASGAAAAAAAGAGAGVGAGAGIGTRSGSFDEVGEGHHISSDMQLILWRRQLQSLQRLKVNLASVYDEAWLEVFQRGASTPAPNADYYLTSHPYAEGEAQPSLWYQRVAETQQAIAKRERVLAQVKVAEHFFFRMAAYFDDKTGGLIGRSVKQQRADLLVECRHKIMLAANSDDCIAKVEEWFDRLIQNKKMTEHRYSNSEADTGAVKELKQVKRSLVAELRQVAEQPAKTEQMPHDATEIERQCLRLRSKGDAEILQVAGNSRGQRQQPDEIKELAGFDRVDANYRYQRTPLQILERRRDEAREETQRLLVYRARLNDIFFTTLTNLHSKTKTASGSRLSSLQAKRAKLQREIDLLCVQLMQLPCDDGLNQAAVALIMQTVAQLADDKTMSKKAGFHWAPEINRRWFWAATRRDIKDIEQADVERSWAQQVAATAA